MATATSAAMESTIRHGPLRPESRTHQAHHRHGSRIASRASGVSGQRDGRVPVRRRQVLLYEDAAGRRTVSTALDSGKRSTAPGVHGLFRHDYLQVYLGKKKNQDRRCGEAEGTRAIGRFLGCVRSRAAQPVAPAQMLHQSCALVHREIAFRTQRVLHFDPKTETFKDDREANALLTKEYRKPWDPDGRE
jgi:hypothetical protein